MKILAIGDVVGQAGVAYLRSNLRKIKQKYSADLVIVNGENAAEIHGIGQNDAEDIFYAGADVITTGNHAFGRYDIYSYLDDEKYILRPANFPGSAPGHGWCIVNAAGARVLVMNLQGNVSMKVTLANPFEATEKILEREAGHFDLALCDFHGEATSEKKAFGYHFDSRIHAVFGTHTHIPTADLQILPGGSGYITDLGMCGARDSVLGMEIGVATEKFVTHMPTYYRTAQGPQEAWGAIFELDPATGKCLAVEQVHLAEDGFSAQQRK